MPSRRAHLFSMSCRVILSFLQDLIDKHRAFSPIKVYLAAIAACHVGFEGKTASQHPLVCRFMKGTRSLLPVSRSLVPLWDLAVVLNGLKMTPFEPLEGADMKHLSLKTVLLLALASAKRVSDIHALSVHPSCTQFAPGQTRVLLKPNPAFTPKVVGSCTPIDIEAFPPGSSSRICCVQSGLYTGIWTDQRSFVLMTNSLCPGLTLTRASLLLSNGSPTGLWR